MLKPLAFASALIGVIVLAVTNGLIRVAQAVIGGIGASLSRLGRWLGATLVGIPLTTARQAVRQILATNADLVGGLGAFAQIVVLIEIAIIGFAALWGVAAVYSGFRRLIA